MSDMNYKGDTKHMIELTEYERDWVWSLVAEKIGLVEAKCDLKKQIGNCDIDTTIDALRTLEDIQKKLRK
jgi:hypothetical protein